jgi:hypothetical protein
MAIEKEWMNCKNRKTRFCPHNEDDLMKNMNDGTPRYWGKVQEDNNNYEEADKICAKCDSFKQ